MMVVTGWSLLPDGDFARINSVNACIAVGWSAGEVFIIRCKVLMPLSWVAGLPDFSAASAATRGPVAVGGADVGAELPTAELLAAEGLWPIASPMSTSPAITAATVRLAASFTVADQR